MKLWIIGGLALAATALAGCTKKDDTATNPGGAGHHGRYVGVGIYSPEEPWTRMVDAQRPKETAAAEVRDDQAVIVVVDSDTGEIRSCGDLSGYCIGQNPWAKPLPGAGAPVNLSEHVKKLRLPDVDIQAAPTPAAASPAKK